jgi:hypothetical protein
MKHVVLAALLALASSTAFAQSVTITDTVAGHGEVTYFDLMKQVIPDLTPGEKGATGHLPEGIVHLEGDDAIGETPQSVKISSLDVDTVRSGGEDMLWVLADLGEGGNIETYTLLAVFDDSPMPRLLDAKEVDVLDFTSFVGAPFAIGTDSEAMLVGSGHFNSNESFQHRTLAHVHEGKLQVIATISLFGLRSCEEWTTEELTLTSVNDQQERWAIDATILRKRALAGQNCEEPLDSDWRHREFVAQYVWDSTGQHYVVARTDFEDLARMDEILH